MIISLDLNFHIFFKIIDEEFDVQGFGDYEYDDYEDYDETDYGDFEGNDIDNDIDEEDRGGRSLDFDEKNTSKLAKLETDLKREKSETEKLRAEIAALKTSIEKSDANMDPNSDKLSAEIAALKTRKKQLIAELEPNSDSKGYGNTGC